MRRFQAEQASVTASSRMRTTTSNSETPKRLKDEKGTQKGCNPPRVERTERLEGSRFVAWQLYGLLAGGSRERLEVWQFYGPFVSDAPNRRDGQNLALGLSREPPATNR
jgi:hypothetical protein